MADGREPLSRRAVLQRVGGVGAGAAVLGTMVGTASAQAERPDFGDFLEGVDGGYQDFRGQDQATVLVGAEGNDGFFAFEPAGCWVDIGTTVQFEWTGQGGAHNVVTGEGPAEHGPAELNSGAAVDDTGVLYEYTFEEEDAGITQYVCTPHIGLNMFGAIAAGEDVPTVEIEDAPPGVIPGVPGSATALGVTAAAAVITAISVTYGILRRGGDFQTE